MKNCKYNQISFIQQLSGIKLPLFFKCQFLQTKTEDWTRITTTIGRQFVRETDFSRHHGDLTQGPLETPPTS